MFSKEEFQLELRKKRKHTGSGHRKDDLKYICDGTPKSMQGKYRKKNISLFFIVPHSMGLWKTVSKALIN